MQISFPLTRSLVQIVASELGTTQTNIDSSPATFFLIGKQICRTLHGYKHTNFIARIWGQVV